ncbi:MAG: hypothetical protein A2V98_09300 [Planctomycetes bacterium RBG_16_64_12]|nr:MAG: hypothetical protein A2V98_09300 [Planctomycetes bacterium RBG_16_64_12]
MSPVNTTTKPAPADTRTSRSGTSNFLGRPFKPQQEILNRISIDPRVCGGKPCIRGHRIWVSLILDFLANGSTRK